MRRAGRRQPRVLWRHRARSQHTLSSQRCRGWGRRCIRRRASWWCSSTRPLLQAGCCQCSVEASQYRHAGLWRRLCPEVRRRAVVPHAALTAVGVVVGAATGIVTLRGSAVDTRWALYSTMAGRRHGRRARWWRWRGVGALLVCRRGHRLRIHGAGRDGNRDGAGAGAGGAGGQRHRVGSHHAWLRHLHAQARRRDFVCAIHRRCHVRVFRGGLRSRPRQRHRRWPRHDETGRRRRHRGCRGRRGCGAGGWGGCTAGQCRRQGLRLCQGHGMRLRLGGDNIVVIVAVAVAAMAIVWLRYRHGWRCAWCRHGWHWNRLRLGGDGHRHRDGRCRRCKGHGLLPRGKGVGGVLLKLHAQLLHVLLQVLDLLLQRSCLGAGDGFSLPCCFNVGRHPCCDLL